VCLWQAQVSERLAPAADKAVVLAAELLPALGEPQIKALEQRYARNSAERRDEFLQPNPADRLKASTDRTVKRIEMVYGPLDQPQRKVISAGLAVSPFDAETWLADNARRQRDVVATLRKLVAERPDADARLAALQQQAGEAEVQVTSLQAENRALRAQVRDLADGFDALDTKAQKARRAEIEPLASRLFDLKLIESEARLDVAEQRIADKREELAAQKADKSKLLAERVDALLRGDDDDGR
jgi:chromosome segregation ATPase